MKLDKEQINTIDLYDIKEYIMKNQLEYKEYIETEIEKKKNKFIKNKKICLQTLDTYNR